MRDTIMEQLLFEGRMACNVCFIAVYNRTGSDSNHNPLVTDHPHTRQLC